MFDLCEFSHDSEFQKLMQRESNVDLAVAALELARDADTNLDFQPSLDWIKRRADELIAPVAKAGSDETALRVVADYLADKFGLHGDAECFDFAESSYLNHVIETGRGLPITLSVLYMSVADRLGLGLDGVAAPMHFLTRLDCAEGPMFLDAFSCGRIMPEVECREWIQELADLRDEEVGPALKPVEPRAIIIRMLHNLKSLHARYDDWGSAFHVQKRLVALQPASYRERRDLALISLRANRPGSAIGLLKSLLEVCPGEERELLQQHLTQAERDVPNWN